jgi:GT2 family glycosyltransferase
MYGDDLDWCRRCWKSQWQVVFFPVARAIHDQGKITAPYPVHFAVAQQQSVLYYWQQTSRFLGRDGNSEHPAFAPTWFATVLPRSRAWRGGSKAQKATCGNR